MDSARPGAGGEIAILRYGDGVLTAEIRQGTRLASLIDHVVHLWPDRELLTRSMSATGGAWLEHRADVESSLRATLAIDALKAGVMIVSQPVVTWWHPVDGLALHDLEQEEARAMRVNAERRAVTATDPLVADISAW